MALAGEGGEHLSPPAKFLQYCGAAGRPEPLVPCNYFSLQKRE
ncbi:hypothetical protein HanIR_Chr17g0902961 [Helianthus annuus]|nr:hypothetical protein HanIR_Chr17g0902961 [Helianthus annuus]